MGSTDVNKMGHALARRPETVLHNSDIAVDLQPSGQWLSGSGFRDRFKVEVRVTARQGQVQGWGMGEIIRHAFAHIQETILRDSDIAVDSCQSQGSGEI